MPRSSRFPWLSLSLLAITYACLSWTALVGRVSDERSLVVRSGLGLGVALLMAWIFSLPLRGRSSTVAHQIFHSDKSSIVFSIIGAFGAVLMLVWIEMTSLAAILLAAQSLAKFDLSASGRRHWRAFALMLLFSALGISGAAGLETWYLAHPRPEVWPAREHPHASPPEGEPGEPRPAPHSRGSEAEPKSAPHSRGSEPKPKPAPHPTGSEAEPRPAPHSSGSEAEPKPAPHPTGSEAEPKPAPHPSGSDGKTSPHSRGELPPAGLHHPPQPAPHASGSAERSTEQRSPKSAQPSPAESSHHSGSSVDKQPLASRFASDRFAPTRLLFTSLVGFDLSGDE